MNDLNNLKVRTEGDDGRPFRDHGITSGVVEVHFRHIEDRLIDAIREADAVVGCVAWLTSERILSALSGKKAVSLVVQKEDFLRPDLHTKPSWPNRLRQQYAALPGCLRCWHRGSLVSRLSYCCNPDLEAVRCVGNYNRNRLPAFPRCHHKFAVFCRVVYGEEDEFGIPSKPEPYAAWTGSFNFTKNSGSSLENAVLIRDLAVASAYYHEWAQVVAVSEPLDWESDWVEPEWRIGS